MKMCFPANQRERNTRVACVTQSFCGSALIFREPPRVDLISDALPFGRLWYGEPDAISNAVNYAKFRRRSHDSVIRAYDHAGNLIETHAGDFKEW
jgi:hypothetical protein